MKTSDANGNAQFDGLSAGATYKVYVTPLSGASQSKQVQLVAGANTLEVLVSPPNVCVTGGTGGSGGS
jgi:hypothetical protein